LAFVLGSRLFKDSTIPIFLVALLDLLHRVTHVIFRSSSTLSLQPAFSLIFSAVIVVVARALTDAEAAIFFFELRSMLTSFYAILLPRFVAHTRDFYSGRNFVNHMRVLRTYLILFRRLCYRRSTPSRRRKHLIFAVFLLACLLITTKRFSYL
jgi:hypothetical protein